MGSRFREKKSCVLGQPNSGTNRHSVTSQRKRNAKPQRQQHSVKTVPGRAYLDEEEVEPFNTTTNCRISRRRCSTAAASDCFSRSKDWSSAWAFRGSPVRL